MSAQVSPVTFTAPIAPAVATAPTLKSKKAPAPAIPGPNPEDLFIPTQIRNGAIQDGAGPPSSTSKSVLPTAAAHPVAAHVVSTHDTAAPFDPSRPTASRKRSPSDDGQIRAPPALRINAGEGSMGNTQRAGVPKVRPLPPKPKPAASLFIPKKPTKV